MHRAAYTIAAIYDTETCNIGEGENTRAYPILFIDNDIRDVDLYDYEPERDDKINLYRYEQEMQTRIDEYCRWGIVAKKVPIICAYNLMFDLQPLMEDLSKRYDIEVNAQSSTNVYTLDLYEQDTHKQLLRFWDTYHLEMRGLSAMGETCGLAKAKGDWDYSLIRTPETPLTDDEIYYARRDTQVIPSYLRYLLHANEWMQQDDLGSRILTKTSIVRQMARREIAQIKIEKKNGKHLTLDKAFTELCGKELPATYSIYALRKACFRGGFTFTAAAMAGVVVRNVASLDVTSMHHTFINGRYVPQDFKPLAPCALTNMCNDVLGTSLEDVLENYAKPFYHAFHARIRFDGIRLKKGTCFERWGIALEPMSKFKRAVSGILEYVSNDAKIMQENELRALGWFDQFEHATFAFGKLYKADAVILHLNELELWTLSRVYEWDKMTVIFGEGTSAFKLPPDFVTMQSNKLFEMKDAAKFISHHYVEGEPYPYNTSSMPDGIAAGLKDGTLSHQFFDNWYTSTVKGMFNGIYGTMAQDVFKPDFCCINGEISVNKNTLTTPDNFEDKKPNTTRVLYTYGMRIVGGSRMHLVIAMELLNKALGKRIKVTGGDTDSVKVSCGFGVTDADLARALEPIAKASKAAIDRCMIRMRKEHPKIASTLTGIGGFEIENEGHHYALHMDVWNKARISWDGKRSHITCAGLARPIGQYHIESFIDELIGCGYDVKKVFENVLGYNVFVCHDVCHSLEGHRPACTDVFENVVTDYMGNSCKVIAHESVALYPTGRWLGETLKLSNALSVRYLHDEYGRDVLTTTRYVTVRDGHAVLSMDTKRGVEDVMIYG